MNTPPLSPDEHQDLLKRLETANGYLGLGMHQEAWDELEDVPAEQQALTEVLKVRVDACLFMKKWHHLAEATSQLVNLEPDDPRHIHNFAMAVREIEGEKAAVDILERARHTFPQDAGLAYNLACYRSVLGNVEEAKVLLKQALKLDPDLQETAIDDPDLAAVWDSM